MDLSFKGLPICRVTILNNLKTETKCGFPCNKQYFLAKLGIQCSNFNFIGILFNNAGRGKLFGNVLRGGLAWFQHATEAKQQGVESCGNIGL